MKSLLTCLLILAMPAYAAETRVFVASDSTAQNYGPERYPQAGWGTMLRCAFGPDVKVENRAVAARSTRSFIAEGRLDEIARDIRAGDTLLIQFGHNDANAAKPERYASVPDYVGFLRRYLAVATTAGAQPVLLTPVTRRNFVDGHVAPSFPDYSAAVRALAAETRTPLIDLDTLSGAWVQAAGPDASKRWFLPDDTHFSELGARGVADIVARELARLGLPLSGRVLTARPALALVEPLGSPSCTLPPVISPIHIDHPAGPLVSIPLPEGNYRVTVTLGDRRAASDTTILAEQRRLMLANVRTVRGKFVTRSFVVNVRTAALDAPPANAPGGVAVRLKPREMGSYTWDDSLTLELLGPAPRVAALSIESVRVPTIFLFGDSTVTDQRYEPWASWGQMLPAFVGPAAAVANHAESGETLKSFIAELRLDKALSAMKPGDFALIQFGHNDQKFQWPQTYAAAATTYRAYLRAFIAEVRLRGGTPLLVTPPERRNFTPAGTIRPTIADYALAMRAVAEEEKVPLIDLSAASIRIYEALGPERAARAFGPDTTHHSDYGAYLLAQAVADGVRSSGSPLAALLAPGLPTFDPAHPTPPEAFDIPPSAAHDPALK